MFSNKHTTLYYLLKVTYKIIYKNKEKQLKFLEND